MVRVEDLTWGELTTLKHAAYDARMADDLTIRAHASQFYDAWMKHLGNSKTSMVWALNNESLPYREHLISLLVSLRLFGKP